MSRLPPNDSGMGIDPLTSAATVVRLRTPSSSRLRWYRIALSVSVALNVPLIAAGWLYLHFEGLLSIVDGAVGFFF